MNARALRDVAADPAGEPYYRPGDLPPRPASEIPFPPFSKGTLVEGDGSYPDVFAIKRAGLDPGQTLVAQFLWAVRGFLQTHEGVPDKPLRDWSIEEIIDFARGTR